MGIYAKAYIWDGNTMKPFNKANIYPVFPWAEDLLNKTPQMYSAAGLGFYKC